MNAQWILDMLVKEEGEILHAYQDQLGFWTIGVGRLIDRRGGGISHEESRYLLANDVRSRIKAAETYPWFDGLDDARQAVIVGMIFQLGKGGFASFKNTIAAIARHDFKEAAILMLKSKWADQTPDRAKRMAHIMETGEWPYV